MTTRPAWFMVQGIEFRYMLTVNTVYCPIDLYWSITDASRNVMLLASYPLRGLEDAGMAYYVLPDGEKVEWFIDIAEDLWRKGLV